MTHEVPTEMLDIINHILQNSHPIQRPPTKLRHLWTYPELMLACDLMHFDFYESDARTRYLCQSGGILGETIWYQQNETTTVASAPAEASKTRETNP